uniref:LO6 n=1 Tax=Carp adomavirus TaxID=2609874 RepID=A0A6F9F7T7_9VIRU|nr:TPA_asm: LO6 [Carp adomavirus]
MYHHYHPNYYPSSYRAAGYGPFWPNRGQGMGAFHPPPFQSNFEQQNHDLSQGPKYTTGSDWISRNSARSRKSRRSRRGAGFNIRALANKAWSAVKQNFIPLVKRHGKTFLSTVWKHAVENGPSYANTFRKEGVQGVKSQFLDHLPALGTDFVRNVSTRGSGPACDILTSVLTSARPDLEVRLSFVPTVARSSAEQHALQSFVSGQSGSDSDVDSAAPLQMAQDMVLKSCIDNLTPNERGGFLPALLPLLAPLISGAAGAFVGSIPKMIELANKRGSGDASSLYIVPPMATGRRGGAVSSARPTRVSRGGKVSTRGGAAHRKSVTFDVQLDGDQSGQTGQISLTKKPGFVKWEVTQARGRGRPVKRVLYVSANMSLS